MKTYKDELIVHLLALRTLCDDLRTGNGTEIIYKVRKQGDEIVAQIIDLTDLLGLTKEINYVLADMLLDGDLVISEKLTSRGAKNVPCLSFTETLRKRLYAEMNNDRNELQKTESD